MIELATMPESEILVTAIVGMIGIRPTVAAMKAGKDIALANKETLVTAGHIIMPLAEECGVQILPVDSEHSAIFQCLHGENRKEIEKLLITASGGPFRGKTRAELENVTVEQALRHPNWSMGHKITIDSATLVNKGLEVMEAKWLFGVDLDHIQVVVQPKSIIHSMVEFKDGAVMAQLGTPDMKLPIQYALYYPERRFLAGDRLDFAALTQITFEKPDMDTFLGLPMAMQASRTGGSMPTVFNAANERAVALFLAKKIRFLEIYDVIAGAMEAHKTIADPTLEQILAAEQETYEWIANRYKMGDRQHDCKILIAVLIFGITVIIHELGHFLLAKANGITVTEFSIGFGPTVVKTEKGGTVYSLKLLPFGGACQMLGEDGEEEGEGTFNSKSVWARISVVAAGPVFNMILAFFCAIFVISYAGSSPARVTEVADGSPEAEAGLEAGDIITSYEGRHISIGKELNSVMTVRGVPTDEITLEVKKADGEKKTITYEPTVTTRYMMGFNYDDCDRGMEFTYVQQNMPLAAAGVVAGDLLVSINGAPITCVADFTAYQTEHPFDGSAVTLEYEHSGKTKEITVTPVENTYANVQFSYQLREKQSPIGVLKYSVLEIKYWVRTVIDSVSMLITGQYSVNDLSGPVGVVDAIGTAYDDVKSQGVLVTVMTMLNMVILLSSNLGVMNLLPLPALDGGRLVFLIIEAIRRKPIRRDLEGMVHFAGLVSLMALMVYVMIHDVQRIL